MAAYINIKIFLITLSSVFVITNYDQAECLKTYGKQYDRIVEDTKYNDPNAQTVLPSNSLFLCMEEGNCNNLVIIFYHVKYTRRMKSYTMNICKKSTIISIMLCGDVAMNPGPIRFPCGICGKPVAKNHRAMQCDTCDVWSHIKCLNIQPTEYTKLGQSDEPWYCQGCLKNKSIQDEVKCAIPGCSEENSDSHITNTLVYTNLLNTDQEDINTCTNYINVTDNYIPEPDPEEDWMNEPENSKTENLQDTQTYWRLHK